jgi:hypothetical protein
MTNDLRFIIEHCRASKHTACKIGRNTARHNQAHATRGAFSVKRSQTLRRIVVLFQARMH